MNRELVVRIADASHEGVCIIAVEGDLTLGWGGEAIERLMSIRLAEGQRLLILDLSKTRLIDSSGLGGLTKGISRIKMRVGKAIILPNKRVTELLQITKLNLCFDVATNLDDAFATLTGSGKRSLPRLHYQEVYSIHRIDHGENQDPTFDEFDKIGPRPVVEAPGSSVTVAQREREPAALPVPRSAIPIRTLAAATVFGLLVFFAILAGLVWVARQVSSPWVLSLVFAVAILFSIHIVVFVLAASGFLSEKSAEKLMSGALGKVPGLKAWLPGVASKRASSP